MTNKEHPHAEVLRAIADGVPLSEFEVYHTAWRQDEWQPLLDWCSSTLRGEMTNVCRKPQYIMVNGFKVPKPLDVMPTHGDAYYTPNTDSSQLYGAKNAMTPTTTELHVKRGVAHKSIDAAIAHAKAMLGIDPEYFK